MLKRLSEAQADGDHILAVIKGSAVNQDGRSNGLTAPNGPAQEAVIRQALANASVSPADVSFVETHGTGTPLGDPIEVQSLAAVLGTDRPADRPLLIGSVKTNVGHLESAAGVAGLLKVILALQHRTIPPHLNFHKPNPYIPWDEIPVKVITETQPWPETDSRRLAGLSSSVNGSTIEKFITSVFCARKGSMYAVATSGSSFMSDSWMAWKPRIEDPSKA